MANKTSWALGLAEGRLRLRSRLFRSRLSLDDATHSLITNFSRDNPFFNGNSRGIDPRDHFVWTAKNSNLRAEGDIPDINAAVKIFKKIL